MYHNIWRSYYSNSVRCTSTDEIRINGEALIKKDAGAEIKRIPGGILHAIEQKLDSDTRDILPDIKPCSVTFYPFPAAHLWIVFRNPFYLFLRVRCGGGTRSDSGTKPLRSSYITRACYGRVNGPTVTSALHSSDSIVCVNGLGNASIRICHGRKQIDRGKEDDKCVDAAASAQSVRDEPREYSRWQDLARTNSGGDASLPASSPQIQGLHEGCGGCKARVSHTGIYIGGNLRCVHTSRSWDAAPDKMLGAGIVWAL